MAKTLFSDNPRSVDEAHVSTAFLNSIYRTSGGHKHDGGANDGSASKINPLTHVDPSPAAVQTLAAADTISPSARVLPVMGSGGAVTLTSNPQVTAGSDGDIIYIEGQSDTDTVTVVDGNGLDLRGGNFTLFQHDIVVLKYGTDSNTSQEVSRSSAASEKSWAFLSPAGSTGTFYAGGFYIFGSSNNDFSPSVNFGTANVSYAAHFFVVLGEVAVDEITITITGTKINDLGVRSVGTATLTIPDASVADTYFETPEKWIGLVAVETTAGTAKNCNYGFCKYWDNNNNNFRVVGSEATWLAGANDNAPNILIRHHKDTGWAYNAGAEPTPPTALADMQTDHNTEFKTAINVNGSWKRSNLNQKILGGDSEGTIIEVVNTANKAFAIGTFLLRVRQA